MDSVRIQPASTVGGKIRPPGSKSITNRALVCAALATGESTLFGALDSDDTGVMIDGLKRLGIKLAVDADKSLITVEGCGGKFPADAADLFVGNSGTTIRFLTAAATLGSGEFRLDGVPRMRERPIVDLLNALRPLGAQIETEQSSDCPPVVVNARGLDGGTTSIRGSVSSQYLSALLMSAPYAKSDVVIQIDGELVSKPYVAMTLAVMESFGVRVSHDQSQFRVDSGQRYQGKAYQIEPDASAASYFWAAAAITGGSITVSGLGQDSLQGDVGFCDCLQQMGCHVEYLSDEIRVTGAALRGIAVDMNAISDTVQTLAAVALFADGPTRITGVGHIRHKETDRIGNLATELRKLGAEVEEFENGLEIRPNQLRGATIETYDDHRMAMSLSLVGLRTPDVVILDPGCTSKTYPNFFSDLDSVSRTG